MGVGLLVALTLPGVVLLLLALTVAEQLWSRFGRRSRVHGTRRRALSAGGMDVFSAAVVPGRAVDLDERLVRAMTFEDAGDAAPPYGRIDLNSGVAHLDVR